MAKSRVSSTSRKLFYITLGLSLFLAVGYASIRSYFRPQQVSILAIDAPSVASGQARLTGILRKDTTVGKKGNFILITDLAQVFLLDVDGLDGLLDQRVVVDGYVVATTRPQGAAIILVNSIIIKGSK